MDQDLDLDRSLNKSLNIKPYTFSIRLMERNNELLNEYETVSCQLQTAEEEIEILEEDIARMQEKVLALSTARMLRKRNSFFLIDQPRSM